MTIPTIFVLLLFLIQGIYHFRLHRYRPSGDIACSELNVIASSPSIMGQRSANVFITEDGLVLQDVLNFYELRKYSSPMRRTYRWRDVVSVEFDSHKTSKLSIDTYNVKIIIRTKAGPIPTWIRARNPHEFVQIANEQIATITNEKAPDAQTSGA